MAALIAALRDFDLAEEALADATESALVHWERTGMPDNPQGWLLRVARRKAIDRIRRQSRWKDRGPDLALLATADQAASAESAPDIPDERLRLIFTCCHPALDPKSRIALTLRTLGGLTTAEIARAFLDEEPTMGQRLSRAKTKIAAAGIPFVVPGPELWGQRLNPVLAVIYLIFNEGYAAMTGDSHIRAALCDEALWLGRMMRQLLPDEAEVAGLLALMLLTDARRNARIGPRGEIVPLDRQDRTRWRRDVIEDGHRNLDAALAMGVPGPYQIKAAIAALHAAAPSHDRTDWPQIVALYDALGLHEPSPVVRLNRAVAMAEVDGPVSALAEVRVLMAELDGYQPYHAALADLLARTGESSAAAEYDRAIALSGNEAQRDFLRERKALMASSQKKGRDKLGRSPTGR